MTPEEIRASVLRLLGNIAPEADLERLEPDIDLRRQVDIDSMDFLNFVIAIHETLGVEIPEKDYQRLATLRGIVEYVASALETRGPGGGGGKARS